MATQCRSNRHFNKKQSMRICTLLGLVLIVGALCGFFIGKFTTPQKTITVTETIEVPTYKSDMLVDTADVFLFDTPLSDSLQRYIYEICADEKVPVTLAFAMIEHESGFNPEVISATDDYGLMQINAINHDRLEKKYRCADMLNPYQNVFCGISIISSYIEKYEDCGKALMAYNMGEYGAKKAWENGVTSTKYSETILNLMDKYEEVMNNATGN